MNIKDLEGCLGAVKHRNVRHWLLPRRAEVYFLLFFGGTASRFNGRAARRDPFVSPAVTEHRGLQQQSQQSDKDEGIYTCTTETMHQQLNVAQLLE